MKSLKRITAVMMAMVLTMGMMIQSYAVGSWQQADGKWYHRTEGHLDTGWHSEGDDIWYFLGTDGTMGTGWYTDEAGGRYYLNQFGEGVEGLMRYGWYQSTDGSWYFLCTDHSGFFGKAVTGWNWIDGYCYYFDASGKMAVNVTTPDGYIVNGDGKWIVDGTVQYQLGKGYSSNHVHNFEIKSTKSGGSSGRGGSGGGSGSDGSFGGGSGGNSNKVYEKANKDVFASKENVKAFASETEEDKKVLKDIASSIVDYWIEAETVDAVSQTEGGNNETRFQSVLKINLVVTSDCVLMDEIGKNHINENDVIYIPACEAFPAGMSFVYLNHDDDYAGDGIDPYENENYEVIHVVEATFSDLYGEEIYYSAGGVNSENPVQYIWTPALYGEEIVSYLNYMPGTLEKEAKTASASNAKEVFYTEPGEGMVHKASDSNADIAYVLATPSQVNALRSAKAPENKNHFSISQIVTDKGTNITANAKDIILFDRDGNPDTTADQILLSGKIGVEKLNPVFGFHWSPSWTDLMPKQLKAVVQYDEVIQLQLQAKDEVELKDFIEKMREAIKQPDNKQQFLNMEIQGVDWDNTIVLACFGVNVGLNKVSCSMKEIQSSTKDIKNGMQPMVVFMVLMDMDGNISVTTTLEMENRNTVKKGINIQKEGFTGLLGSTYENRGDFNTSVDGYNVNIYNSNDTDTTVKISTEGEANFDLGVGLGAGISCMGIMPAMLKGTVGMEAETSGTCEASWNNKDGMNWNTESEARLRAYLRAQALIKLKVKIDLLLLDKEAGFDKEFDLADITLMEERYEQHFSSLRYDDSYEKYLDYTKEQLAKKFKSYNLTPESIYGNDVVYYDGEIFITSNEYGTKSIDPRSYDSNTIIIIDYGSIFSVEGRELYTNISNVIKGVKDNTKIKDLSAIGNWEYEDGYPSDISISTIEFIPNKHPVVLLNYIFEYEHDWENNQAAANPHSEGLIKDFNEAEINDIINTILKKYRDDDSSLWEPGNELDLTLKAYIGERNINPKAIISMWSGVSED